MPDVVSHLVDAPGADVVSVGPIDERFHGDWSGVARTSPLAVILPRTTDEVATALRICHAHGQPVVPQGGLTGLAGGATPRCGDIAISMERMSAIEEIDAAAGTVTVQAGAVLQTVQEAAVAAGWQLAYDLGARGSCQIGGNLATNAGGNRVIRFGMAREQVLGLEVVLADGTVLRSLTKMLKNNAGYDLKQLFIGSEGTLGIITRAVLRLQPLHRSRSTALLAVPSFDAVVAFLRHAQRTAGGVTAYEVMWPEFYAYMTAELAVGRPLPVDDSFVVLIETSGDDPEHDPQRFETMLAEAVERGLLSDAVIAASERDSRRFWELREAEPIDRLPSVVNFDVSLAIGDLAEFAAECEQLIRWRWPDAHVFVYGHVGDSNLHISLSVGRIEESVLHEIDDLVYGVVRRWHGSVSAEHGIGTLKRDYLSVTRSAEELDVMRRIKAALDPAGIMNPTKVLP